MFLDYKKETKDLVLDLINRDNPQLEYPLDHDNCIIGVPVPLAVADMVGFRNTSVMVTYKGEPAQKYVGPVRLYYRRLTGAELFPGGRIVIDHYRPSGNIPKQEYIDLINDKYGLELRTSDISTGDISNNIATGNIAVTAGCLAFVGNFPFRRIQALIPINVPVPEVVNNWLPSQPLGGLDYTSVLYGVDFTPFDHLIEGAGNTFQNLEYSLPLMEVMSSYANVKFGPGSDKVMDSTTMRATIYERFSSNDIYTNNNYQKVMIITPSNANSWLKGSIYLHFDKDL